MFYNVVPDLNSIFFKSHANACLFLGFYNLLTFASLLITHIRKILYVKEKFLLVLKKKKPFLLVVKNFFH